MKTKDVLERLPESVRAYLEQLRKDYSNPSIKHETCIARSAGYVHGLYDAGLVSDRERRLLFVYTTVAKK